MESDSICVLFAAHNGLEIHAIPTAKSIGCECINK